jgi:hypothetical protein
MLTLFVDGAQKFVAALSRGLRLDHRAPDAQVSLYYIGGRERESERET